MRGNTIRFGILKQRSGQRDTLKLQDSLGGLSVEEVFTCGIIIGFSITKQEPCQRDTDTWQQST
jgi:hypothetical protein